MLDLAALESAGCVVEMGAGTGPHTREIVARLAPGARFLAFEIDPDLAGTLAAEITDPRVEVINDSAEHADAHLGGRKADIVVSALPFTSLPPDDRRELLSTMRRILAEDGVLLVLQYSPFLQAELERTYHSVERHFSPLNVPPAFLYACRPGPPAARPSPSDRPEASRGQAPG
jgi:phospholipid N-methyltransferase